MLSNLGARKGVAGRPMAPPKDEARGTPIALAGASALPAGEDLLGAKAAIPWPTATGTVCGVGVASAQPPSALLARTGATVASPVSVQARSLFLLLAAQAPGAARGDEIGRVRVGYDDGRSEFITIVAGMDVGELRAEQPPLVERAQLAMRGGGDGRAALYLRQWDNPTPAATITAIELSCTRPRAAIALLALTALH